MKTTAVELCRPCEPTHEPEFSREHLSNGGGIGGSTATLIHDLQQADRRKDEFLAMLGHEMRNPLAPIRNAAEIFRLKGAADPELQEVTAMVERQIRQLTRLLDDLLDVSRVGHGKINLQLKSVDLKAVVALAIEIGRPLIDARKHTLTVSIPSYAVDVEGDSGRLAQVVANLLNNSSKFMDDGGRIELTLENVGRWAVLSVRDTGVGIEASMLPRIFDLFMQVNGSISRANEGLGIGLALVRNVVELHGGTVQGASAGLGHGTEFVVRLPLLETPTVVHAYGRQEIAPTVNAPTRRILIIDDNEDATESMAMLLRTAGHDVRTAYDGGTALVLCRLEAPEVVICDIIMPDMCGYELARELRDDISFRDTFLIALSGYAQDEDRHRSKETGFHAHLTKPVHLESLKELLANLPLLTGAS
jgi:CheY-like chemotaxis protein/two-component sensor histidine kinase